MGVTIKDIARIANVSHTTVSRALNNSPYINENTKKKIQELAKELNYVPNYNAKGLVTLRSNNIGVFFTSISVGTSSSFFHEIINAINEVIHYEYNIIIRGIDECEIYDSVDQKNFAGIIVVSQSNKDDEFIGRMIHKQIPIVVINRAIFQDDISNILSNDTTGSYDAVSYLINNNHKKIAMIEGNKEFESTLYRRRGYIRALEDNNIEIKDEYIIQGEYTLKSGYDNMNKLLSLKERPTAVFCANDDIALGGMKAIFNNKLSVPEDISIIGFDDSVFGEYAIPSLTTVKKNSYEISKSGAEKLIEIINNNNVEVKKIYVEAKLVIRESVNKAEEKALL